MPDCKTEATITTQVRFLLTLLVKTFSATRYGLFICMAEWSIKIGKTTK
ncbi:hypothetical protein HMPREF3214_00895 [Alloscardovia omnicolens]|nr:hypothetical protein HMPREF3214_00895 [Alloscardovia omnicolens]